MRKRSRPAPDAEAALQRAVHKYFVLNRFKFVAMRNNSGGRSTGVKYGLRVVGKKLDCGGPDFIIARNGYTIGLELKKKGGKPRGEQLQWLRHVGRHMPLFLCDEVADVVSATTIERLGEGLWERRTESDPESVVDGWVRRHG